MCRKDRLTSDSANDRQRGKEELLGEHGDGIMVLEELDDVSEPARQLIFY